MHLKDALNHTHHQYHILYQNKIFFDQNKPDPTSHPECQYCFNQLKFILPSMEDQRITFTLVDDKFNILYKDIIGCVDHPKQTYPLGVCAYISEFNSDEELFSWLSFQMIQNVSKVILYAGSSFRHYNAILERSIRSGFVILHDFTWYRRYIFGGLLQRNHQQAQINACVNRYKYRFDSLISSDIDEYAYSMAYPYNLPAATSLLHAKFPNASVIQVFFDSTNQ
jgi:hypothetical protein